MNRALPGTPTDGKKYTLDMFILMGAAYTGFDAIATSYNATGPREEHIYINSLGRMAWDMRVGGSTYSAQTVASTVALNQWNHIHVEYDSTQAVANDRVKVTVNGTFRAWDGTTVMPSLNQSSELITNTTHQAVGRWYNAALHYLDGLVYRHILIDGEIVTADNFADGIDAKPVTVSTGNNGWLLDFADSDNLGLDTGDAGANFTLVSMDGTNQSSTIPDAA